MLLDSNRLTDYTNQDSQFDNRYLAKLPPVDQLKQRGNQQIIYLVQDESQQQELDDLNDDLVEWEKNGINVRMLRLSDFKPGIQPLTAAQNPRSATTQHVHHTYYYGGSPFSHGLFYNYYYYTPPREIVVVGDGGYRTTIPPRYGSSSSSPQSYPPPSYRPTSRPTIFSSARVGATSGVGGVGKTRPSGFGRTSVRRSENGQITGFGRSGSYGRSSGGWFGG
jgi:hypothetical protein